MSSQAGGSPRLRPWMWIHHATESACPRSERTVSVRNARIDADILGCGQVPAVGAPVLCVGSDILLDASLCFGARCLSCKMLVRLAGVQVPLAVRDLPGYSWVLGSHVELARYVDLGVIEFQRLRGMPCASCSSMRLSRRGAKLRPSALVTSFTEVRPGWRLPAES